MKPCCRAFTQLLMQSKDGCCKNIRSTDGLYLLQVYILRGKDDALCTKNLVNGESVYNEKRVTVDVKIVLDLYLY